MRRARGFTLLEAVVALAIFAGLIGSALVLRARTVGRAARLAEIVSEHRAAEQVLELAAAGLLLEEAGARVTVVDGDRPEDRVVTWRGTHLGRAYECVRRSVLVPDPLPRVDRDGRAAGPRAVRLLRYEASCGGARAALMVPPEGGV